VLGVERLERARLRRGRADRDGRKRRRPPPHSSEVEQRIRESTCSRRVDVSELARDEGRACEPVPSAGTGAARSAHERQDRETWHGERSMPCRAALPRRPSRPVYGPWIVASARGTSRTAPICPWVNTRKRLTGVPRISTSAARAARKRASRSACAPQPRPPVTLEGSRHPGAIFASESILARLARAENHVRHCVHDHCT
jgi:hypothetical protein